MTTSAHSITVEAQPKRLIVRLHALTSKRHRTARDSLHGDFPAAHWDTAAEGYAVPVAYRARLESWLSRFNAEAVEWIAAERVKEVKSA